MASSTWASKAVTSAAASAVTPAITLGTETTEVAYTIRTGQYNTDIECVIAEKLVPAHRLTIANVRSAQAMAAQFDHVPSTYYKGVLETLRVEGKRSCDTCPLYGTCNALARLILDNPVEISNFPFVFNGNQYLTVLHFMIVQARADSHLCVNHARLWGDINRCIAMIMSMMLTSANRAHDESILKMRTESNSLKDKINMLTASKPQTAHSNINEIEALKDEIAKILSDKKHFSETCEQILDSRENKNKELVYQIKVLKRELESAKTAMVPTTASPLTKEIPEGTFDADFFAPGACKRAVEIDGTPFVCGNTAIRGRSHCFACSKVVTKSGEKSGEKSVEHSAPTTPPTTPPLLIVKMSSPPQSTSPSKSWGDSADEDDDLSTLPPFETPGSPEDNVEASKMTPIVLEKTDDGFTKAKGQKRGSKGLKRDEDLADILGGAFAKSVANAMKTK